MIKDMLAWLIGKKIVTETGTIDATSKAKLIAIIGVLVTAIPQISAAFGHPFIIPDWVLKALTFAGLWGIRDAIKS